MEEITKILLMGKNGYYNLARKNQIGIELEPCLRMINARGLVPYGLSFTFGGGSKCEEKFGIFGYNHINYAVEEKQGKLKFREDYGRVNLDRTIKGLENLVKEKGADYVLINDLISRDYSTFWNVSGKGQLLLWSPSIKQKDKFKID